jgi:ATP synthase protein I
MADGENRAGFRYLALGTEFAAAVVGLTLLGYWIDRHFGSSPWGVLGGALIGLVGGMFNLVREALGAVRAMGKGGDNDPRGRDGR